MVTPLTKSRVLMGINFRKNITLKSYGDAEAVVRPVSDAGLAAIQVEQGYGLFDAIRDLSNMGMDEEEINSLVENETSADALKKLAALDIPPKLFQYMIALCKRGMVPIPDPECPECKGQKQPNGAVCPACDIRDSIGDLIGFSTLEIGVVILGMSMANWEEIEDFFKAQKAASGPEPSPSPA